MRGIVHPKISILSSLILVSFQSCMTFCGAQEYIVKSKKMSSKMLFWTPVTGQNQLTQVMSFFIYYGYNLDFNPVKSDILNNSQKKIFFK